MSICMATVKCILGNILLTGCSTTMHTTPGKKQDDALVDGTSTNKRQSGHEGK